MIPGFGEMAGRFRPCLFRWFPRLPGALSMPLLIDAPGEMDGAEEECDDGAVFQKCPVARAALLCGGGRHWPEVGR